MEVLKQDCLEVGPLNDPSNLSPARVLVVKSSFMISLLHKQTMCEEKDI